MYNKYKPLNFKGNILYKQSKHQDDQIPLKGNTRDISSRVDLKSLNSQDINKLTHLEDVA